MTQVYFADLTHTAQGIMSKIFPIGTGTVAAFACQELGNEIDVKLFKFPEELDQGLSEGIPQILCLSNYAWNLQISNTFAKAAKAEKPDLIVVFGGPNFPDSEEERLTFLKKYSSIDFYVIGEGEEGFVELFKKLKKFGMNSSQLKKQKEKVQNCAYVSGDQLIIGERTRINNLNNVP